MRSFAHPPLFSRLAAFGIAVSAAWCLAVLLLPLVVTGADDPLLIGLSLLTGAAGLVAAVSMLRRAADTVEISADGLRYRPSGRPEVFLAWNEIARVEPQNVMQRLLVTDASGERRIHIEYHLEDFGELRRIILERTATTLDERGGAAQGSRLS